MIGFMNSGGYKLSERVKDLADKQTLVIWGRQDKILPPEQYAERFTADIASARLEWVDKCGHVPHLEQPPLTAQLMADFIGAGARSN